MIESATEGKVNFDDEDPNMSDWSDYDGIEGVPVATNPENNHSFHDDENDDSFDMSDTDASMDNLYDSPSAFVNADKYQNKTETRGYSKHPSRKKRKKN